MGKNNVIQMQGGGHAYAYPFVLNVLTKCAANGYMILGGDIVTPTGRSTYDNWYYNPDQSLSVDENIKKSLECAHTYLDRIASALKPGFYVVVVCQNNDGKVWT